MFSSTYPYESTILLFLVHTAFPPTLRRADFPPFSPYRFFYPFTEKAPLNNNQKFISPYPTKNLLTVNKFFSQCTYLYLVLRTLKTNWKKNCCLFINRRIKQSTCDVIFETSRFFDDEDTPRMISLNLNNRRLLINSLIRKEDSKLIGSCRNHCEFQFDERSWNDAVVTFLVRFSFFQ